MEKINSDNSIAAERKACHPEEYVVYDDKTKYNRHVSDEEDVIFGKLRSLLYRPQEDEDTYISSVPYSAEFENDLITEWKTLSGSAVDANTELMRIKGKNILGDCHDDDPVLQCKQMDIQFSSDDIVEVFAMHGSNEEVFVNLKEEHMTQKERDSDKQIILSRAKAGFPSLEPMD